MQHLIIIKPTETGAAPNERLEKVLAHAIEGLPHTIIESAQAFEDYFSTHQPPQDEAFSRLLFVVDLGETGINLEYMRLLAVLRRHTTLLEGCLGAVLMDAKSELYTKSSACDLVFSANQAGCAFIGRSLVEGTASLKNFSVTKRKKGYNTLEEAYLDSACAMLDALMHFAPIHKEMPKLTVLHASSHKKSNTFALWHEVASYLDGFAIEEIGLRNGAVQDCAGCPYNTCLHFGEKESCFYGGVMVDNVYPAVKSSDAIVMVCPNYNDAISANLTAFINRLTALYRKRQFYDKAIFAVVVSGYSGCDILAKQLIAALNMNKSFYLPAHFAIMAMANDPGDIYMAADIDQKVQTFAKGITKTFRE